jgi:hypothetical protein
MTVRDYFSKHEIRGTLIGGAVSAMVLFFIIIWVGRVHSFQALRLIEAAQPTARFLAASVVGGAVTVLALLLTLLGLSLGSEFRFSDALYARAAFLTWLSVAAIVLGTLILLAVAVPVEEVEELANYYATFYYVLAVALSLLGGMVIAIGVIIGFLLRGLIAIGHSEGESDLLHATEEEHEELSRYTEG